ncbi:hypothetical protein [Lacihabitans lacunae]|jgi:hypothetical protein|uniref:Membrane or secreted protein n=1 Tax=Lacihabitans lacunae TaxID=1028214 RepID=A0ABV7Z2F5_9BACT
MLPLFLVTLGLILFGVFMFSVRLIFIKNGEFKGTCASNNPMLQKEGAVCGVCGRVPGEPCADPNP